MMDYESMARDGTATVHSLHCTREAVNNMIKKDKPIRVVSLNTAESLDNFHSPTYSSKYCMFPCAPKQKNTSLHQLLMIRTLTGPVGDVEKEMWDFGQASS